MGTTALTIIVPTRNEAPNVFPLLQEVTRHVPVGTKLTFVDDSTDQETVKAIEMAQVVYAQALLIELVHRPEGQRPNGLAGAVALGIQRAEHGSLVIVMDGDLQHPPSVIPSLQAAAGHAEVVVASRYCSGGSADGLDGQWRRTASWLSTLAAKTMFPWALRGVSDPMTGFFAVHRDSVDPSRLLTAGGFKILLELLVTHSRLTRAEVPLQFAVRNGGESKGTLEQGLHYLRQLIRLRLSFTQRLEA